MSNVTDAVPEPATINNFGQLEVDVRARCNDRLVFGAQGVLTTDRQQTMATMTRHWAMTTTRKMPSSNSQAPPAENRTDYHPNSITTSLASSAKDFRHENGRRYHAFDDEAYFLPNDQMEAARLDLQHYIWKITFNGGLGRVPITPGMKNVLDVGTGTGIWAMELAEAHPHLTVIGTDLSPIQPDYVPSNCQFIVDNAEHDWAFDCKFDYIHSRLLAMGLRDWPRYFAQCWDFLEPGGWLETCEPVFPPRRAKGEDDGPSAIVEWGKNVEKAAGRAGINTSSAETFTELLQKQGFENVNRLDIQWPIGPWAKGKKAKLMGRLLLENTMQAIPAASLALFTRHLGWTKEQVDEDSDKCINDARENCYYYPMVLHRAQKPLTPVQTQASIP